MWRTSPRRRCRDMRSEDGGMIDAQQNNISTPPKPAKTGVQSVERAFTLLGLIADAGGQATLSELAERADLPMPTIHRLLRTLVNLGCARQLQDRGYALGPTLMHRGEHAGRQDGDTVCTQLQKSLHA